MVRTIRIVCAVALFAGSLAVATGTFPSNVRVANAYTSSDCPINYGTRWTFVAGTPPTCEETWRSSTSIQMPAAVWRKGYTLILIGGGGGGGGGASGQYGSGGSAGNVTTVSGRTAEFVSMSIGSGGEGSAGTYCASAGGTGGTTTASGYSATGGSGGYTDSVSWATGGGSVPGRGTIGQGGTGKNPDCGGITDGNSGAVIFSVTLSAPSAPTIGTISEGASQSISVPFTPLTNAVPAVSRYDASCTSSDGGTTRTGNATSSPITVANASPGKNYTCTVSAYNGSSGTSSVASNSILVAGAPWNNGGADLPSFTGTAAYKSASPEVLTGSAGTWNTPDGYAISEYTYLWQSQTNCSGAWADAPGATKNTANYTIVSADAGNCLRLSVTATNFFGPSSAAESASSAEVTDVPVFTAQSPSTLGEQGYAYTYTFAASGGRITYSTTAAIAGLSLNTSTGVLSGTPTTSGDFTYTVTATNDSGSATTTTKEVSISDGTASSIEITQQPVAAASGAALTTQPSVRVLDEDTRIIISPRTIAATVSPSSGALAGTLGGTTSLATTDGVATYTNLTLAGIVETDYTLTFAIAGGPSATSSATQVTPGALATVLFTTQPVAPANAGGLMTTQPVVRLEDAQGNLINDRSSTVVVSSVLASSTSTTSGSVGGTTSLSTSTGIATFTNLTFGGVVGTSYKVKAVSGAVSAFSDNVTNSQAGAPAKLRVFTEPTLTTTQLVGDAFNTQPVVRVLDSGDNITTSTATVTATPSSPPTGGTLGGTTSVAADSGTVTFTGLTFAGLVSTNYRLTFSSPGLTSTESDTFQFAAGKFGPVSLSTTTISSSATELEANGTSTTTITVQTKDAGGNNLTTSQGTLTLSTTAGTLSSVTDNANGTYTATFTAPAARGTGTATISGVLAGSSLTSTTDITLKTTQTITFAQPDAVVLGTLPYTLTATSTSGLAVSFTSSTTSICTITTAGRITIKAVGTCTINADQAGNSTYWVATQVARSFLVNATTPTAPYITSVTPGNESATVAFVAPGFNGGATISDYQYSINAGSTWTALGSTSSPLTISALTNGTAYVIRLRAVNSAGAGTASDDAPSVTPSASGGSAQSVSATTASAPRNATLTANSSTDVTVDWLEPLSNGGATITRYTVTVSPSGECTPYAIAVSARTTYCLSLIHI